MSPRQNPEWLNRRGYRPYKLTPWLWKWIIALLALGTTGCAGLVIFECDSLELAFTTDGGCSRIDDQIEKSCHSAIPWSSTTNRSFQILQNNNGLYAEEFRNTRGELMQAVCLCPREPAFSAFNSHAAVRIEFSGGDMFLPTQVIPGAAPRPAPDLAVTATARPDPIMVDGTLTYILEVKNLGQTDAESVVVRDTLPMQPSGKFVPLTNYVPSQGTCTSVPGRIDCNLGYLAAGGLATVTIEVMPKEGPATLENTVTVSATTSGGACQAGDPQPADNTATARTNVGPPVVRIADLFPTAAEGDTRPGVFVVERTGSTTSPLIVNYTYSGTATPGTDFLNSGAQVLMSVEIPAGQTQARVDIFPVDDADIEGTETVVLTLQPKPGAYDVGTPPSGTVNIADNDAPSSLVEVTVERFTSDPVEGGSSAGAFLVSRSSGPPGSPPPAGDLVVRFHYGGSATPGLDFFNIFNGQAVITEVTIPDGATGQSVAVFPVDDNIIEGTETVELILDPSSVYVVGIPDRATLNILDND